MVNYIVIILCFAAIFVGIESKPMRKDASGRSVLKINLSQDDLKRGVSIQITNKAAPRKQVVHNILPMIDQPKGRISTRSENRIRKGRRANPPKRRQLPKKLQSKILKALASNNHDDMEMLNQPIFQKSVVMPNIRSMRNKRSLSSKKSIGNDELQVDDLRKFAEDNENEDAYEDYSEDETINRRPSSSRRQQGPLMRKNEQKQQLQMINAEDYQDYAFDTIDNDQSDDDNDELLRSYYSSQSGRGKQTQSALYDDYDSFSDFMHMAAADSGRRDTRNMNALFYGDEDSFLNDEAEDNKNIDDEYDEYYDDE